VIAVAHQPVHVASSTSYCEQGLMADGSFVRPGSVAMNTLPLGSIVRLVGVSFEGRRLFTVRDRIGWGSDMDLWTASCTAARAWGRRAVRYRVVRMGHG
jgi:3D (Asp-Asp-Asp) domain-containing protein